MARTLEQKQMSLRGFTEVKANLNREIQKIEKRTMYGMIKAVDFIHRKTETESPKVPVDTGNLRHSWFTSTMKVEHKPVIKFGFSANYALWVHEMVDANFHRNGSGAKFLEAHLMQNHNEVLRIIGENARII